MEATSARTTPPNNTNRKQKLVRGSNPNEKSAPARKKSRRRPMLHIPSILESWLRENYAAKQGGNITKASIYRRYKAFCSANALTPKTQNIFGKVLKKLFPNIRSRRLGPVGKLVAHYSGVVRVKKDGDEDDADEGDQNEEWEEWEEEEEEEEAPSAPSLNSGSGEDDDDDEEVVETSRSRVTPVPQQPPLSTGARSSKQGRPDLALIKRDGVFSRPVEPVPRACTSTPATQSIVDNGHHRHNYHHNNEHPLSSPFETPLTPVATNIGLSMNAWGIALRSDVTSPLPLFSEQSPFGPSPFGSGPDTLADPFAVTTSPLHYLLAGLPPASLVEEGEKVSSDEEQEATQDCELGDLMQLQPVSPLTKNNAVAITSATAKPSRGTKRQRELSTSKAWLTSSASPCAMRHLVKPRRTSEFVAPLSARMSEYELTRFSLWKDYINIFERRSYPFITLPASVLDESNLRRVMRNNGNAERTIRSMSMYFALYLGAVQAGNFVQGKDFFMHARDALTELHDVMDLDVAAVMLHMAYGTMYFSASTEVPINLLSAAMSICETVNARDTVLYRKCISTEAWICKGECIMRAYRYPLTQVCKVIGTWPQTEAEAAGLDAVKGRELVNDIINTMTNVTLALNLCSSDTARENGGDLKDDITLIAERLQYCYNCICAIEAAISLSDDITFLCKFWMLALLANVELALGSTDKAIEDSLVALNLIEDCVGRGHIPVGVELYLDCVANVFFQTHKPSAMSRLLRAIERSMGQLVCVEIAVRKWEAAMGAAEEAKLRATTDSPAGSPLYTTTSKYTPIQTIAPTHTAYATTSASLPAATHTHTPDSLASGSDSTTPEPSTLYSITNSPASFVNSPLPSSPSCFPYSQHQNQQQPHHQHQLQSGVMLPMPVDLF
eukprot:TRINITY_DN2091_c2_g1_i1.p1 TRINITY_DN2091_c2_g1~~TRINITY_DN2091_c2_g1_i1.p1  ORF type:complete len:898 (+),score=152.36 TRINITY_DN2091_c2_g1_i1:412-3105(+)